MTRVALLAVALCACATDDDLSEVESASSVYFWNDDQPIDLARSTHQVGMAFGVGMLHVVSRNDDGSLSSMTYDGEWSTSRLLGGHRADSGAAVVNENGTIRAIYHKYGENRLMMTARSGDTWSAATTIGSTLGSATILNAPAAAMIGSRLVVGYCTRTSETDAIRVDVMQSDGSWSKVAEYKLGLRCKHVAFGVYAGGNVEVIGNFESGYNGSWYMHRWRGIGIPMTTWSKDVLPMKSKKPISIVTCDGVTHMVHGGYSTPSEIWWTVRENGAWLGDVRIPDQASGGGAAIGCFYTTAVMVHNGGTTQLWSATYSEP